MSLKILILTDGKIGDLVQCRGVAAHLTTPPLITETTINPGKFWSLPFPFMPVQPSDKEGKPGSPLTPPYPDVILASGRRTLPYLRAIRKRRSAATTPLIVFLKNPRLGSRLADLIWAPIHDGLEGDNIISTHTSPHTLTPQALAKAAKTAALRFAEYPRPSTGIILGGDSGAVSWNTKTIQSFSHQLAALSKKGSFLITPSRRTPDALLKAVVDVLQHHNIGVWDGEKANPYIEILTHCDRLIVTGDSHNMVSECLTTGSPVFVHRPIGLQPKLNSFLNAMEMKGAIQDLSKGLIDFPPVKIDATEEIAEAIRRTINRL